LFRANWHIYIHVKNIYEANLFQPITLRRLGA